MFVIVDLKRREVITTHDTRDAAQKDLIRILEFDRSIKSINHIYQIVEGDPDEIQDDLEIY